MPSGSLLHHFPFHSDRTLLFPVKTSRIAIMHVKNCPLVMICQLVMFILLMYILYLCYQASLFPALGIEFDPGLNLLTNY